MRREEREFDRRGRDVTALLDRMAAALAARDARALEQIYGESFRGKRLGLADLSRSLPQTLANGVRIVRLQEVAPGMARPDVALAEWRQYLDGFDAIEQVRMRLERFDRWRAVEMAGIVDLELIGRAPEQVADSGLGSGHGTSRKVVDRIRFRFAFEYAESGELLLRRSTSLEGSRTFPARVRFAQMGARAGLDFVGRMEPTLVAARSQANPSRFFAPRFATSGIAAADYDGDGYCDLFIPDGVRSRLLRNRRDGTFEEVTQAAGLGELGAVRVALLADYDNDGHKDLFLARLWAPNQLFHNRGDGTFAEVTAASGLGSECCTTAASWADYDLDGDLDLYLGRYIDGRTAVPAPLNARNGEPNRLYRNDGEGHFTEVSEAAGVALTGLSLGTVFGDYDGDGDADLFVANDFGRATLYRNRGDGSFADATLATGAGIYGFGGGATMADYDNDGDLDLYVTGNRPPSGWYAAEPSARLFWLNALRPSGWRSYWPLWRELRQRPGGGLVDLFQERASGNVLLRNFGYSGEGPERAHRFEKVSATTHASPFGQSWGSVFADFDNDGWQDLYLATGWSGGDGEPVSTRWLVHHPAERADGTFPAPERMDPPNPVAPNRHLRNMGDGSFHPLGHAVGSDLRLDSRAVVVADFLNRGALDLVVSAIGERPALLRNEAPGQRHWLSVELTGAAATRPRGTNRDAVGARVTLQVAGLTQTREVVLGEGYASQNSLRLHFGLGDRKRVDRLTVRWPRSGETQSFADLAVDRIVAIEEGVEVLVERHYGAANPSLEQ